jgi:hypothetical protein
MVENKWFGIFVHVELCVATQVENIDQSQSLMKAYFPLPKVQVGPSQGSGLE